MKQILTNLVLLCHRHHWSVHEGGWQLVTAENRRILAIPPSHSYGRGLARPLGWQSFRTSQAVRFTSGRPVLRTQAWEESRL